MPSFFAYPLNKDAINMEKGVVAMVFSKRVRSHLFFSLSRQPWG